MGYRILIQKEVKMEVKIEKKNTIAPLPRLKNVAAYARVSSSKDAMQHSLAAQISYYSGLIQSHAGWRFAGVFADDGLTGTKESREGFQKLLVKCRAGEIDMVITKSISRFARNTVTLLKTVRELKSLGIDVYFEEQSIHSASSEGELMLTILASFAQEECLSASENQKWRIKRNFEQGRPWSGKLFGYRLVNGTFILLPDEAAIVRRVFEEYLSGKGTEAIANGLNADGLTNRGGKWYPSVIAHMLRNVNYTGNLLLQKTYREDHLTKRTLKNDGVLPQYYVENAHEAIIDADTFEAVRKETERRQAAYRHVHTGSEKYAFTGMIVCAICGRKYKRKKTHAGPVWICPTFNSAGKAVCPSKQIPDETLRELTAGVDFDTVERMTAENGNIIHVCFRDGMERTLVWKDRSRADSWSDDMKLKAKAAAEKRYKKNGER